MKAGVAAFVAACPAHADRLADTAGVTQVITAGEETGCSGAEALVAANGRPGRVAVGTRAVDILHIALSGCGPSDSSIGSWSHMAHSASNSADAAKRVAGTMPETERRRHRHRRSKSRYSIRSRDGVLIRVASIIATAVVAVAGAAYFLGAANSRLDTAKTPAILSLRLNASLGPKYAGEIVAARSGLFAKNNVQVEVKPGGEGIDTIASVVNGTDTIGVTNSIRFLIARSNGQPIVAFAADYLEQSIVFYALERSKIHAPQDFVGKRVGRRADTNMAIMYDALLKATKLSRSQIPESATETNLDALLANKVDVIPGHVGQEAFVLREKDIPYNVVRVSDYGIHVPDTVYFTTEKMLRDHPTVVQHVLEAVISGWRVTYADPSKAVPIIVQATGNTMSPEQVQFELAAQRDYVMPLGRRIAEFDNAQWKQLRQILMGARLIDGSVDMSQAINYDLLKEAYRKPIFFGNDTLPGTQ